MNPANDAGEKENEMKFVIGRRGIDIVPEDKQDEAYIEDTLGLKKDFDSIPLVRQNAAALSCLGSLTTNPLRARKDEIPC
jgi:hypothetical protein